MRDVQIELKLHHCQVWSPDDTKSLLHATLEQDFVFLQPKNSEQVLSENDLDAAIALEKQRIAAAASSQVDTEWSVMMPAAPSFMQGTIGSWSFRWLDKTRNYIYLGGILNILDDAQRETAESYAQRLLVAGRALYPLARPILGWVDEGYGNDTLTGQSVKLKLLSISWVNFFGRGYTEKYGRSFLLGLPGYRTELLGDGGIFHQLSPTFFVSSEEEASRLRRQVRAYCKEHGFRVTCRAPYIIATTGPTQQESPEILGTDQEFGEYLTHALSTTLVLDDGTRVKPIYIPWEGLTDHQRDMALNAIKHATVSELKRAKGGRIRLEFNEVPELLERLLKDIAQQNRGKLEWQQVDM